MPLVSINSTDPAIDGRQSMTALQIRKGVLTGFAESGIVFIPEFNLPGGRRADLAGIDQKGSLIIIEIKSSVADFNADGKWQDYLESCDKFYFASHPDVPMSIFPEQEGLILADSFGCEIVRGAETRKLAPARRKSLTLQLARQAATRLQRVTDFHDNRIP